MLDASEPAGAPIAAPPRRGGGGAGGSDEPPTALRGTGSAFFMGPTFAGRSAGLYGGGSLRPGPALLAVSSCFGMGIFSYGELERLDTPGDALDTDTQSGSSVILNGFDGRFGFSATGCPFRLLGMGICARAGCLLSNHHRFRSELAGGKPGSIASYPIKSSSSVSSPSATLAVVSPSSAFLRAYSS